ncbi:pilus assembly protein FimT [Paracidovorax avenae]|uniref:GspH/FimT family pseudopilin n=1 Tax=Paracidovorax avenae TaxID=80867 RepID=UPI000D205F22|nr:GspH/FimT family pseudopilin [Paracidovorax avenae]AVS93973.1 pilus assembly protein FimT [Paracidovorax avenae]AVT13477.1 pilus assembly protein FimT [Paracidovorax avenae]
MFSPHVTGRAAEWGFTLIELLVTVALAAILAMLAAPAIGDFIVKSRMTNAANEFSGSILRARNEAVSRNTCVSLCMSSNADESSPSCSASGANWQVGWIAFMNTSCDSSLTAPPSSSDVLLARVGGGPDVYINSLKGARRMMFNSRGSQGLANADRFDVGHQSSDNYTRKYGVSICLDALGRSRSIPAATECSGF